VTFPFGPFRVRDLPSRELAGSLGEALTPDGVREAINQVLTSFGVGPTDDATTQFVRVFPEGTLRTAYWSLTTSGRPGKRVDVGRVSYTLTLDPEYTTPGLTIAVHFGDMSHPMYLRPGETLHVPAGFSYFICWNPSIGLKDLTGQYDSTCWPAGAFAFLVGRSPGARPEYAHRSPRPAAQVLNAFAIGTADPNDAVGPDNRLIVSTAGLRGYRLSVFAKNGSGTIITPPSDLAFTLRTYLLTAPNVSRTDGLDTLSNVATMSYTTGLVWAPGEELLTGTQTAAAYDREIGPGSMLVTWRRMSLAGTNVSSLFGVVEGW
jgi:hypothetical protein